ncbi:hypothetical protein JDV02_002148 [Purpureocillium takamizusanense]|uniref:Uncharacterized protein n=1 Tax=Purpureocillium takamizusanense TaxID=2060973 RepID=A0A9Q8V7F0_9HYPO|nr:uncharacterized protein JDV02_002148 [Purpureocillium takamizusanense]UNI15633.1 hypothetical protein JDV02_002148 [Purpureocillium takamizusanense]
MTPPCHSFPASELPSKVQLDARGRRRKPSAAAVDDVTTTTNGSSSSTSTNRRTGRIDLAACELLRMLQYKCEVQRPHARDSPVQCYAVERLFRRCHDRNGPFTVETTAWEGKTPTPLPPPPPSSPSQQQNTSIRDSGQSNESNKPPSSKPYQWSSSWLDADVAP